MFFISSPAISVVPVLGSGKTVCWWKQPEEPTPFSSDYSWQESTIGSGSDSDSNTFSPILSGDEFEASDDRVPESSGPALRRVRTINKMAGKVILNRRRLGSAKRGSKA